MDKYLERVHKLNVRLTSPSELLQDRSWLSEFFGFESLKKIEKAIKKFKIVYDKFDEGKRAFIAQNEYEEAALADLRYEMETLFYQVKKDCPGKDVVERGALCDSMRILISIFIFVPTIVSDRFKDDILQYAKDNSLIEK